MGGASWVCRCGAVASRTLRAAPWCVAVLLLGACASAPATARAPAHGSAKASAKAETASANGATASETKRDRADTGRRKRGDLDLAARVAPNGAKRQIAYLRQARTLYQAFIDHAKGRPDMHQAVVRSRERIDDIDKTIEFLQGTDGTASSQR